MMDIENILEERGKRYGSYLTNSEISQDLKSIMHNTEKWSKLSPDKKECLEMIALKVSRILNGDAEYIDSWQDIIGYSELVIKELD